MELMQDLKQADDNVLIGFVFALERMTSWCEKTTPCKNAFKFYPLHVTTVKNCSERHCSSH